MWRNTDNNLIKILALPMTLLCWSPVATASLFDCEAKTGQGICRTTLHDAREKLTMHYLTALLVSDAPIRLLQDTQQLWLSRTQQCKQTRCYSQHIESRIDDLNLYTSLNQTLTQHYLKFEHGQMSRQPVHLKLHQLSKNSIKIEGIAYRNPNNRIETQAINFLAYTTPEDKNQVVDNEHDCSYTFNYTKALLIVSSSQQGCERFNGVYRIYD